MSDKQQPMNAEQYQPNFEELLNLAKDNPELFEAKRREYIELFFTTVPSEKQRRLRGLQWQIDQARHLARTPMASCLNIMNMMRDSLHRLNNEHRGLLSLTTPKRSLNQAPTAYSTATPKNAHKGEIIPFPTR